LQGHLPQVTRVEVECYGSLGQTGKGHGTGKAIILGLSGFEPESVDIDAIPAILARVEKEQNLQLAGDNQAIFPAPVPSSSTAAKPCRPTPTA